MSLFKPAAQAGDRLVELPGLRRAAERRAGGHRQKGDHTDDKHRNLPELTQRSAGPPDLLTPRRLCRCAHGFPANIVGP
jgi:hypothetical protein